MSLRPLALVATAMMGAFVASPLTMAPQAAAVSVHQATASSSISFASARVQTYTVQPGNTLSGIAWRFHTSIAQLVALNHLANPNFLRAGQVLQINSGSTTAASASSSPTFASTRASTTVATLAALNHLSNPNSLRVGQVLLLSGNSSSPAPVTRAPSSSSGSRYTVKPGNTLSQIGAQFGVSWQAIAAANGMSNPNALEVGQVLTIPASGSTSASIPAASSRSNFGQALVDTALSYLGVPYVWSGASPAGFDCSGLVQYVFARNGVNIPRTSWAQYAASHKIAKWQLQPGDLVFFSTDGSGASHVGLYIGSYPALGYSQAFVEAPEPGLGVRVS
ncbi:MAG: LysM peptidoglycan-binding domain-containing protein, partial [Sulfobacillus sp.]